MPAGYVLKDVEPTAAELGCISLRGTPHCSLRGHPFPSPLSPPPPARRMCFVHQEGAPGEKRPRGVLAYDATHNIARFTVPLEFDADLEEGYA